jgi:hypothetical protein
MTQTGQNKAPIGGGGARGAGPATGEAPSIIAKGTGHVIYREQHGDTIRLIAKYVDSSNSNIYSIHIVELDKNTLRVYTRWNISPERRGERLDKSIRLEPDKAAELRRRMLEINTAMDFTQFMRELGL